MYQFLTVPFTLTYFINQHVNYSYIPIYWIHDINNLTMLVIVIVAVWLLNFQSLQLPTDKVNSVGNSALYYTKRFERNSQPFC